MIKTLSNFFTFFQSSQLSHDLDTYSQDLVNLFTNYTNSFTQMFKQSMDNCKLLLIFHHSPRNPQSSQMLIQLLQNLEIVESINKNYYFYVSNVNTITGRKLEELHAISEFPSVSVVFPFNSSTGQLLTVLPYSSITANELNKISYQYNPLFVEIIQRKNEETQRQREREEQEAEYQKALLLAKQQEELKAQENEKKRKELEESQKSSEIAKQNEIQSQLLKTKMKDDMLSKKAFFEKLAEPTGLNVSSVMVRFPNGTKVKRVFNKSDKIQLLYDWVDSNQSATRDYSLIKTLTKHKLLDKSKTFDDEQLCPSAMLVLEIN
ncbi:hypothetical protein EIN_491270 [Entamoeba invadens IP1]|uniref:UBX domain-containing protein n=1 Tax=Entamoeba invadens IP1 TaxID=370355 RepID=A0A0A1U3Z0_ENTIV|nr:hypothetical protein EIN_491270 [Entamoeba invadens IP1]ELP88958.1 hypothetical protein EIN_491270 [Entamoeba invadens IP1]|eukprot:XP_004255729.1 hypothetical protein EIN_491270 [Entamoeba invadens IP1]